MKTTVYIVRHAEAEGNVYRRIHGQYDSLLTERAWKQLPYVAKRFSDVEIDCIYSSDLYRAEMTAKAIADEKGLSVTTNPRLREINMGDWEDLTWAELPIIAPEKHHEWQTQPHLCVIPNGESVMSASHRMFDCVRELAHENEGKTIVVATHGSTIRGALCIALGYTDEMVKEIPWGDNTCVAKLEFLEDGEIDVVYMNDASHLPEELSTFASVGWKNPKGVPVSPQIWFRNVDLENEEDIKYLIDFAKLKYQNAYGNSDNLDETEYINQTRLMQLKEKRAVTFGIYENKPIALVRLNTCDESYDKTGMVGSFVIDTDWQGCGISEQIIGQAISVYRALGKRFLCAYVAQNNERAQGFYAKFGFALKGEKIDVNGKHFLMVKKITIN